MWNLEEIENGGFWTSLNRDTEKRMILRALGQPTRSGSDLEKTPMEVSDVLVHKVNVTTDAGDSEEYIRVVLISPSGETCAFVSNGILSSLRNLIQVFGEPKWVPPLKIKATLVKTRRGFRTYNLEVVE